MRAFPVLCTFPVVIALFVFGGSSLSYGQGSSREVGQGPNTIRLQSGWQIQSSCRVPEKGDVLSIASFKVQEWYPAKVPGAVVSNLVADKVKDYPDPYTGMNLRKMPGVSYPIGGEFANLPIPKDSPFYCSWWYRTSFSIPAGNQGKQNWLHFQGINYRANIWLNGKQIADSKQIAGAFRTYELNVTDRLLYGVPNALAIEVFAPGQNDLGITFVDWNPMPPDKNMGLWREAFITTSGPVAVRHPFVDTKFHGDTLDLADLTTYVDLKNGSNKPVKGSLEVAIENVTVRRDVELAAGETREISFSPDQYSQLQIKSPRVWWPAKLGAQELYLARFRFIAGGNTSDEQSVNFGVREASSELTEQGYRLFKINHKKLLIRGGGWSFDMLLRSNNERLEQEMRYALDMNLNTIRMEGKIESDYFFSLADRLGMLIMPGWCCCDAWEHWGKWTAEDKEIAADSLRSQLLRIRSHPSIVMWLNGSDNPPTAEVERRYLEIEKQVHWPTPTVSSATQQLGQVSGRSGVKMTGPYEYVPPSYWLLDTKHGGAYGFNTETSPGPAIPPPQSLRKFIPTDHLWPIDDAWNFHAGGGKFKDLKIYTAALDQRYGPSASMEEYSLKSQAAAYEGERAMFEAYRRNHYTSTGVIQWMLNNAWPSLIWHLYDWYLMPAGGYFGTKKANEPVHIQYSEDDRSVVVVNSFYQKFPGMKLRVQVFDFDLNSKFDRQSDVDVEEDSSKRVLTVPQIDGLSSTYFLRLNLTDAAGKMVSDNFYWLSTKPDVLDWAHSEWYYTPTKQLEDFTALKTLPKLTLTGASSIEHRADATMVHVTVRNPGKALAFQVRLRVTDKKGEDVLPVLFEDNYFPLFPGEERTLSVTFDSKKITGAPEVLVEGWNVQPGKLPARDEKHSAVSIRHSAKIKTFLATNQRE
ncbi:MAG TPA: glycoside hydrolase family 2 protein [Candidatus Angelobacter sp.]|nr:glycoside hydrolase family 2 protein [Candidatus Angelobacter sp.]